MSTLPCVQCGITQTADAPSDFPLVQGTVFDAAGNYGSAHFDPMTPAPRTVQRLRLVICDGCLTKLGKAGKIQHVQVTTTTDVQVDTWDPDVRTYDT